jgi:hypothetical protein
VIPKKFKLRIKWSVKEDDFMMYYPRRCDGAFIQCAFLTKRLERFYESSTVDKFHVKTYDKLIEWDFLNELWDRGYDKTTFKLEVTISKTALLDKFPHLLDNLTVKETNELKRMG